MYLCPSEHAHSKWHEKNVDMESIQTELFIARTQLVQYPRHYSLYFLTFFFLNQHIKRYNKIKDNKAT